MRQRGPFADSDDRRKRRAGGTGSPRIMFDGVAQIFLGGFRSHKNEKGGEGAFGYLDSRANLRQLPGVLDHAQALDAIGAALPVQARRPFAEKLEFGHGDGGRLETDRANAQAMERLSDGLRQFLRWRANVRQQLRAFVGQLAGVARIADHQGTIAREKEYGTIAAEAGQVGDVDRTAYHEGVDALVSQQGSQPFAALRIPGIVHETLLQTIASYCLDGATRRQALRSCSLASNSPAVRSAKVIVAWFKRGLHLGRPRLPSG